MAAAERQSGMARALHAAAAVVVLSSIVAAFFGPFLAAFLPPLWGDDKTGALLGVPRSRDPGTPFMTLRDGRNLTFQVYRCRVRSTTASSVANRVAISRSMGSKLTKDSTV